MFIQWSYTGERKSQADQTEHCCTFRPCPPGQLTASTTASMNAERKVGGGHGWLPPYLGFFLAPVVFKVLLYAECDKVDTVFASLELGLHLTYVQRCQLPPPLGTTKRVLKKASQLG